MNFVAHDLQLTDLLRLDLNLTFLLFLSLDPCRIVRLARCVIVVVCPKRSIECREGEALCFVILKRLIGFWISVS